MNRRETVVWVALLRQGYGRVNPLALRLWKGKPSYAKALEGQEEKRVSWIPPPVATGGGMTKEGRSFGRLPPTLRFGEASRMTMEGRFFDLPKADYRRLPPRFTLAGQATVVRERRGKQYDPEPFGLGRSRLRETLRQMKNLVLKIFFFKLDLWNWLWAGW